MSNARSSIFETFTVEGENSDNQTLEEFFQNPQMISSDQFYTPQQQNSTYFIQSELPQKQLIQKNQNQYIIQQQDSMVQQYVPQQQGFMDQQQVNLLQQQLNQQKQLYQQKNQYQQQQYQPHQLPADNNIVYISNDNNQVFINSSNQIIDNTNDNNNEYYLVPNSNNTYIVTSNNTKENDNVIYQEASTNNNFYDNSCTDFTGVEEVVEELWMSCESHDTPAFDGTDMNLKAKIEENNNEEKKRKKKKKNLPTCYSLFYRDTQLAIKEQRPEASVHEVTSIVDSMWKQLEPKHRAYYEKLAEVEKAKYKHLIKKEASKAMKGKETKNKKKNHESKNKNKSVDDKGLCRREGCSMKAIDDVRWSKDYCSTQCVVSQCKSVFKSWVVNRKKEAEISEKTLK